MKAVILAGGLGTRISEESHLKPKPMIEIGGKPILWHIMKIYSHYGINDFYICLGYKGYIVKEYFANYLLHNSNITYFDLTRDHVEVHQKQVEPWRITLFDTGLDTQTGGRLKRVRSMLNDDEPFCCTYGDGVSNVRIDQQIAFHKQHGKLATVTAIQPPGRYGSLDIDENAGVRGFREKPIGDGGWINGGFFIFHPSIIDKYIKDDDTPLELDPLQKLSVDGQLRAYRHDGFWQAMDTLRDKTRLEELWESGTPPWKIWA
jgi:glucose-1-phosphate cytidylyltransferase